MFIVFEGPDCSSKTSQIRLLSLYLIQKDYKVTVLKEPGSTELGEQLRKLLLQGGLDSRAELALFFASRCDNVSKNILIKKNVEIVLCDRYIDSTVAYQCYGNETLSEKTLRPMLEFFSYNVKPDITFVLDVEYEEATRRMVGRENNHYDTSGEDYFKRVQSYYRSLNGKEGYHYIDTTNLSIDDVHHAILKKVDGFVKF